MYMFRKDLNKSEVLDGRRMSYICEEIGVSRVYIYNILNKKSKCSKLVAFALTKFFGENKKIEDFFEKIEKEKK